MTSQESLPVLMNTMASEEEEKPHIDVVIDDDSNSITNRVPDIQTRFWKEIYSAKGKLQKVTQTNKEFIGISIRLFFLGLFCAYVIYACMCDFQAAIPLLVITGMIILVCFYVWIRDNKGDVLQEHCILPVMSVLERNQQRMKRPMYCLLLILLGVSLFMLTRKNPVQLISFCGLVLLILVSYLISKHPEQVQWRPVLWGLVLQFLLGLFVLRSYPGVLLFQWINGLVVKFFASCTPAVIFLFGEDYMEHFFAFAVMPIVFFFSSVVSILYYLGVLQKLIEKMAWLMQRTMKTTAIESLSTAGNVFFGSSESALVVAPYLERMTRSELHAVMTGGMATVAGGALGAYVLMGIDPTHLIAASVMSAPAALAVSKLVCPETEHSHLVTKQDVRLEERRAHNIVEAASNGASAAIPIVLGVAANLIAFIALLALVNGILGYACGLVGFPDVTFELICSYVFMPLAFVLGVEWSDCRIVAELIGLKTFLNEFYAYEVLGEYIRNRETGEGPTLSMRSEVIATYALCGFSNIGQVGISLGVLTPLAPSKATALAQLAMSSLYAGSVACFSTACLAGLLYIPVENSIDNSTAAFNLSTVIAPPY